MRFATTIAAAALLAAAACGGEDEAASPDDARALHAELAVLPGWSEEWPEAVGSATVAAEDGTVFELAVSGLEPFARYTAHVHDGSCGDEPPGRGHWLADPDGGDVEPNWIHLTVETGVEGNATGTATLDHTVDADARSVVVHADAPDPDTAARMPSDRVLCGDLQTP